VQPQRLSVLIADDHDLFAEALTTILQLDERLEVVGRARDGREAIDLASLLQPDVVLMELQIPVLNGIEATCELRRAAPSCRVVIVTASPSADDERRAGEAGASAYVRKGGFAAELFDAIFNAASESLGARAAQLREMPPARPPAPRSRRLAPLTIRALRAFR
jgi:DNA-binding NarL/FixJ family response regulator